MKLSKVAVNSQAIEQGRWISVGQFMPGVRLKVRGFDNADYQRLLNKIAAETPRAERLKQDPVAMRETSVRLLVETILIDWDGLENDDDTPLTYSAEKARAILSDPDMIVFRRAVDWAASIVGEDDLAEAEATAKN